MNCPFDEAKYKALLKGLEISETEFYVLLTPEKRFDAEFFHKKYSDIEEKVKRLSWAPLNKLNIKLDCSAFYPSVANDYAFNGQGIPFLRVNEIVAGQVIISDNTAFLPRELVSRNSGTIHIAHEKDILIAKGGNTAGKVGYIRCAYSEYATCRDLVIMRTGALSKVNASTLLMFLYSRHGKKLIEKTISQTGQPHLTLPLLERLPIPIFTEELQAKIAFFDDQSYRKIQHSITLYENADIFLLENLELIGWCPTMKAITSKSFTDFQTSGRLDAEYYQPKYDELFARLNRFKTSPLGSIVSIKKSIEPGSEAYQDSGIPFVRIADVSKFGIKPTEIFLDRNIYYDQDLIPKKDTILLSKDGSVGIAYKLEEDLDAITSGALLHLTINDSEFLPDYLTLVLNSIVVKMQADRDAGGSIIQHWKPSEIENVVIPQLPRAKQEMIAEKVQESFSLRAESKRLLELAKQAIEVAIEQGEDKAMELLNTNGGNEYV